MISQLRMVIAGGGTGGHYFPAIAIKKALNKKGVLIKYIGSKYGVEAQNNDFDDNKLLLNITGIQRELTFKAFRKNIIFPFKFIYSYYLSRKLLKDFRPHLVIGTGGYSSGLPLLAAIHLGIKTVIQEQNSYPGITTRYLANRCNIIFIAYNDVKKYIIKKKIIFTGNPIREDIKVIDRNIAKLNLNLKDKKPVLLILGGSQGSSSINKHFIKKSKEYLKYGVQILWQCGKSDYENLNKQIDERNIRLIPFSDDMSSLYSASDIVISRSGALAISEMALMGKAMVLVPFPHSAGNHQFKNAESISKSGAAILVPQEDLNSGELEKTVIMLLNNPKKIKEMENNSIQMASPNATTNIINSIMEVAIS